MNKRKLYEPYTKDIEGMIENGYNIQNIYDEISKKIGIDASIETFKKFLNDNNMTTRQKDTKNLIKNTFRTMEDYMDFYERWVRTSCQLNRAVSNPNRILMRRYLQ